MTQIDHIGIAVGSLKEGLAFYEDLLGMGSAAVEHIELEKVNVAMLPAGIEPGAPRIELLEASEKGSTIARFLEKRGPGVHHIALRVDDLAFSITRLRQAGAQLLNEPRAGAGGHTYVFVHPANAGGVLVELIQK